MRAIAPEDYLTSDSLSGGDYGGMGYIAHVNVNCLRELAEADDDIKDTIASAGMNDWSLKETIEFHCDCPPALIIAEGGYNSITAYVHPDWDEGREAIESLEQYPVLDDDALSAREMELEEEQWSDTRSDLVRDILKGIDNENKYDAIEVLLEDDELDIREQFHAACELHNTYPEFEGGGSVFYHSLDLIADTLRDFLLIEVDETAQGAAYRAIRDGLMGEMSLEVN